jgi:hypothetical protein
MRLTLAILAVLATSAFATSWNAANSPRKFSHEYEYNLEKLPKSGGVPAGWSETYWPSYESGIAHRWNSDDPQDFKYNLTTKTELKNSTDEFLRTLSPAEKFDIFVGRYDYPLVHEEWQRTHPDDASWEGICHGWAPAAHLFKEPNPVTLENVDGIKVPFGSSDIKALLSFYEGQFDTGGETRFVGTRCNSDLSATPDAADSQPECADLDAGAFHIVLINELGLVKKGFVVDRERGIQVWNQPVNSFTTSYENITAPRENATEGANASVLTHTSMTYSKETWSQWEPHTPYEYTEDYDYYLDLDDKGNVIGGSMISWDRVDFAWSKKADPFFGYFAKLKEIYVAATEDVNHTAVVNALTVSVEHLHAPTHVTIPSSAGEFHLHNYANDGHRSWSIGEPSDSLVDMDTEEYVLIKFKNVDTERHHDQISVYEGANGEGALVAVIHGKYDEKIVKVKGTSALVVFKADNQNNDFGGFDAEFHVESSI